MSNKHHLPHSSSIQSIDYHDDTNTLEVCFASGGVHHFSECPKEIYEGLKNAQSPGSYFHTQIRRKYESKKVD